VPDLARLLGEDTQAERLLELLATPDVKIARLTGPPGSGKSYIGRTVAQTWQDRGDAVVVAVGDDANSWRPLYPLLTGLSWAHADWAGIARTGARSAVALTQSAVGGPPVATTVFDLLSAVFRQRIERALRIYNRSERDVLLDLRRLARGRRLLLVADNAHWWDADSLSLLRDLLSERLRSSISRLDAVSILFIDTAEDQDVLAPPAFAALAELANAHTIRTRRFGEDLFGQVLTGFGLAVPLPADMTSALYTASGGHLKVIEQAVRSLTEPSREGQGLDLSGLISGRLTALAVTHPAVADMLARASLLGLSFDENDLACLTGLTPPELDNLIDQATDIGFVERAAGQRLAFSHDVIRESIVTAQSRSQTRANAASFGKCLSVLRPGDYEARAAALASAGDREGTRDMLALACIARLRAGESLVHVQAWLDARFDQEDTHLRAFLDVIAVGYRSVADGNFLTRLPELRSPLGGESKLMAAERDYLAAICVMENQTLSGAREAAAILHSWLNDLTDDMELRIRFLLLLQQAYVLASDFDRARSTELKAYRLLAARQRYDPAAVRLIQIQNRRAGATGVPDTAVQRIRTAVDHFSQAAPHSSRDELEWFRSLTNLCGIELRLGRDTDAFGHAIAAERIALDAPEAMARLDVLANNLVLAAHRSNEISAAEAIEKQHIVVNSAAGIGDTFIHRCNLAGYMLLDGQDDAARQLLLDLESELDAGGFDESYLQYYWGSIAASAAALRGDMAEALERHHAMDDLVVGLSWPCAGYVRRRHIRFADLLQNLDLTAPRAAIDAAMINPTLPEIGPAWPYYGRFVLCCELSFWSDS
jgi:uncharacterized protein